MRLGWIMAAAGVCLLLAASKASGEAGPRASRPVSVTTHASAFAAAGQTRRRAMVLDRAKYGPVAEALTPPAAGAPTSAWLARWRKRLVCTVSFKPVVRVDALSEVLGLEPLVTGKPRYRAMVTVANRSAYQVRFASSPTCSAPEGLLAEGLGRIAPRRTGVGCCRMYVPASKKLRASVGGAVSPQRRAVLSLPLSVTWAGTPRPLSPKHTKVLKDLELKLLLAIRLTESIVKPGQFLAEVELGLPRRPVRPAPGSEQGVRPTATTARRPVVQAR